MDYIEDFIDERQKSWCLHCGAWLSVVDTNKDHVPSKSLLRKPWPDNLPVVVTCMACNSGFSADEEYLYLFLHCVLAGSTDPDRQTDARVARDLRHHKNLAARIERSKTEQRTVQGDTRSVWQPETKRIERVVVKNARGHAFYEYGEPMLTKPKHVWVTPLETMTLTEREEFENFETVWDLAVCPEVGSRMMTRMMTGQDILDGWVVVQDDVYRFSVSPCEGMLVRSVLYEFLATEVYWSNY